MTPGQNIGYEPSDERVEQLLEVHPSGMTMDQIADELHCSKQRVLQILDRAIGKAQQALRRRYGIASASDVIPFG